METACVDLETAQLVTRPFSVRLVSVRNTVRLKYRKKSHDWLSARPCSRNVYNSSWTRGRVD